MPVSDFECQIARGQIGRYLDGGVLSPQALASLEEHLAECAGCKAAVAERRAALLDSLNAPTHAVVSMPVENPLVAALRARAEEEQATPKTETASKPATGKAAPRYAKGAKAAKPAKAAKTPAAAPAKGNMGKPLALAALLAVVLLGMGRISHTVNAPTGKASNAFVADSLPEKTPAAPKFEKPSSRPIPAASASSAPKPATEVPASPKAASDSKNVAAPAAKSKAMAAKKDGSWGDLFQSDAKKPASPEGSKSAAKPPVAKPAVKAAQPLVKKPVVRTASPRPVAVRPRLTARPQAAARRVVLLRRLKPIHRAKVVRRAKLPRRAPRTTVRVYGTDGRLLK